MHRHSAGALVLLHLLLIFLPSYASAAKQSQTADEQRQEKAFIFDRYWSPSAASSWLLSGRALLSEAEDFVFFTKHAQYSVWQRIATNPITYVAIGSYGRYLFTGQDSFAIPQ